MPHCKQILALAAATTVCFGAIAQTTGRPAASADADAEARYRKERATCLSGSSHQDQATCLKEAGAARDEARRGRLPTGAQLEANATARCSPLPEADRADCRSRVLNESNTTVKGNVEGGGVVKETTTRFVVTPEGEKPIR